MPPQENKTAAIKYYCNMLKTYKLTPEGRQKDRHNMKQILVNNKYDASSLKKVKQREMTKTKQPEKKWANLTHVGKETRFITKLFKSTNVKITFTTNSTTGKRLAVTQEVPKNKYDRSGVYQ